jgi:hypothetical protein
MALAEISEVERCVREKFVVKDVYYKGSSSAEFSICEADSYKEKFEELVGILRPKGFLPVLRSTNGGPVIYIESIKGLRERQIYLPSILFCITLGTVVVDGWLKSSALAGLITGSGVVRDTALYVAFMMAFLLVPFGVRYVFAVRSGGRPPTPYFIPGLPPYMPTFGALYAPNEPPVNRDYEIGSAAWATLSGLLVASLMLIAGLLDTRLITQQAAAVAFGSSAHFVVETLPLGLGYLLSVFLHPTSQGTVLSPLVFAGWFGFLISFANMIPARQLEGWRMSSGFLGRKTLSAASLVSLLIVVFVSFWMALFILAVSWGTTELLPLDGISKPSRSRAYLYVGILIVAALLYLVFLYPQLPTFPSIS